MWISLGGGNFHSKIILFHKGSMELCICENCVMTGVGGWCGWLVLGPHNTLPCVLIMTTLPCHFLKSIDLNIISAFSWPLNMISQFFTLAFYGEGCTIFHNFAVLLYIHAKNSQAVLKGCGFQKSA